MKIVVFEVESWEWPTFEVLQQEHHVVFEEGPLTREVAGDYADADIISTFIYSDLSGKTMGVIGTGNIGRHTAKIAKGFGMDIAGQPQNVVAG